VARLDGKRRLLVLVLLTLVPTIYFGTSYAGGVVSGNVVERYAPALGDWNVNMTFGHPAYVFSGQQVTVTLAVGANIQNKNFTIEINDVGAELRQPTAINATSGAVNSWTTLSASQVVVNRNFSVTGTIKRTLTLTVASPPSGGALEVLTPASRVAFNGFVDYTLFDRSGGVVNASPQSLSLVDADTYYQTELSAVGSTSSWLVYQLVFALAAAAAFILLRRPAVSLGDSPYSVTVRSFRAERALAKLEGMKSSGKIGEQAYQALKAKYQQELDKSRRAGTT
jgi:hypothetical protein